ncbi:hypothetical protein SRM_01172 [Salinibacter ruber M8]|uniref:Uncharacterized protein n=1 Tax=Salinibacter ruber (strain M8) TaxID=761659 RepID=D5H7T8_SALRM|nr:hypothetical protein SRM_01172 [Salinibacter ruber M8]
MSAVSASYGIRPGHRPVGGAEHARRTRPAPRPSARYAGYGTVNRRDTEPRGRELPERMDEAGIGVQLPRLRVALLLSVLQRRVTHSAGSHTVQGHSSSVTVVGVG